MKAVLFSAGLGERLRPITNNIPKVMVPLARKPLLQYTIEGLSRVGIKEFYINIFYKGEIIENYFGDGGKFEVNITYLREPKLWGPAWALKMMQSWLAEEDFISMYGDNYTEMDFTELLDFHKQKNGIATAVVGDAIVATSSGIVKLDETDKIVKFKEKPKPEEVFSNLENKGIYVLKPEIFKYIPENESADFGHDLFPALIKAGQPVYGYFTSEKLVDVGHLDRYYKLNQELTSQI